MEIVAICYKYCLSRFNNMPIQILEHYLFKNNDIKKFKLNSIYIIERIVKYPSHSNCLA